MRKHLICAICLSLVMVLSTDAFARSVAKSGILKTNEVWSGEIEISGDVTVPAGVTLTILPGTRIKTLGKDDTKSGIFKDRPEITVYGNLNILGENDNFVVLGEKNPNSDLTLIPLDSTKTIVVSPYKINTEPLREEFKQFRIQYVILWTILSFSIYYAIRNRN